LDSHVRQRLSPETVAILAPHVPRESLERMRALTGRPWQWVPPVIGMAAITLGDHVLIRSGRYDPDTPRGLALIAHEAMHVAQYRRHGRIGMAARYLWGQLKCGFRHDRHPMEIPCIETQRIVRALLEKRPRNG
jgi:hypothetical protein